MKPATVKNVADKSVPSETPPFKNNPEPSHQQEPSQPPTQPSQTSKLKIQGLRAQDRRDKGSERFSKKPRIRFKDLPRERRAKINADAHTAFVVLGALSTTAFLALTGAAVYTGLRFGKAEGTHALLQEVSKGSDDLFTETGKISHNAQRTASSIPGLSKVLQSIEDRAEKDNMSIQQAIEETQKEAKEESKKYQGLTKGVGIAAGASLVGMIVFISAAKISRHRGNMLFRPDRSKGRRASIKPNFSRTQMGASITLKW